MTKDSWGRKRRYGRGVKRETFETTRRKGSIALWRFWEDGEMVGAL